MLATRAPAKINLTLHVLGRREDGYHALESLVAFSGAGDTLSLTPGDALSLDISGPTSSAAGAGDDNLVLRAARRLAEEIKGLRLGRFRLEKRLPVAAGIDISGDPSSWGDLISQSASGRSSTYERYNSDGSKTVTHVYWTFEAANNCPGCDHRYDRHD